MIFLELFWGRSSRKFATGCRGSLWERLAEVCGNVPRQRVGTFRGDLWERFAKALQTLSRQRVGTFRGGLWERFAKALQTLSRQLVEKFRGNLWEGFAKALQTLSRQRVGTFRGNLWERFAEALQTLSRKLCKSFRENLWELPARRSAPASRPFWLHFWDVFLRPFQKLPRKVFWSSRRPCRGCWTLLKYDPGCLGHILIRYVLRHFFNFFRAFAPESGAPLCSSGRKNGVWWGPSGHWLPHLRAPL